MEQQATQGSLDPSIIARIAKAKAERHVTLEDAVSKIHEEMQQEQAAKAQQMQEMQQQAQGMNGQPGQMPDMSQAPQVQPGMGISPDNPASQIQPPTQGTQDLSSLLNNLRRPARESSQEQGMMPGGVM